MTKKLIALLIVGLLWLLPVAASGADAEQKNPAPSAPPSPTAVTIEELQSRRSAIESMAEIDAAAKTQSLKYIDQAIAYVEMANNAGRKEHELSEIVQTAPARLKILQDELKKPVAEDKNVALQARQMSKLELEQQLQQKEAAWTAAQSRLDDWNKRLTDEKAAINQTAEKIETLASRLTEVQTELEAISDADKSDISNYTRFQSLQSEEKYLTAEIQFNELRNRSHNLLVELFRTERHVAQKALDVKERILRSWQAEVQQHRQQEAAEASREAHEAVVEDSLLPRIAREQLDINLQLSNELEKVTREEADLASLYESHQSRLKVLQEQFETAQKRVSLAELTDTIGLALRTQRLNLPKAGEYVSDSDERQIRMGEINERMIALSPMLRELADPGALAEQMMASIDYLSYANRSLLELKIRELITGRIDIIEKLKSSYDRISKLLQDIEFTEQKLVTTAGDFGELLDRHLLWIRSSKPVRIGDIEKLKVSLGWFFQSNFWKQFFADMARSVRRDTATWAIGVLLGLLLILSRGWSKRKLDLIAEGIERQVEDSFLLTIKALGLTIMLACAWPFLIAFPAYQLTRLQQLHQFSTAIAGGMIYVAIPLVVLTLFYNICRKHGLAQTHFQWPESARRTLKANLAWFTPVFAFSSFFLGASAIISDHEYSDVLGKLAILIQGLTVSLYAARILSFKGGVVSVLIEKYPHGWWCRLRHLWYALTILMPLLIIFLAMMGYFYSALEIRILVRNTIGLILVLFIFECLVLRLLTLAHRRIAWEKAVLAQQQQKKAAADTDSGPTSASGEQGSLSLEEFSIGIKTIDVQTRTLLNLVIYIVAVVGVWAIWEPAFPALGIFQDIHLWSYTTVINGSTETVPVTLANIAISAMAIVITIIAVRNLPGLLEMILLNRLPLDPGARYAYSTVSRYVLTAVGILVVLNGLGIQWSKLQWLIAALSVGLGFGLQEIVANFISGLIVLFERPFRLGDTVTVGQVHGTVTRIRIRATTIMDWDRKELIVPNKEFITGQLINWTLTEELVRIKIPIGIAYGSDTDLAEQILLKAAKTNPLVVKSPEPQAVFLSFGDNALGFELRIHIKNINDWIPMLHDMNRTIDKEFRKAGITIAFPQRDVHLDATDPLEVRVVSKPSVSETVERSSMGRKESDR
jgi:potassium efflux system protein